MNKFDAIIEDPQKFSKFPIGGLLDVTQTANLAAMFLGLKESQRVALSKLLVHAFYSGAYEGLIAVKKAPGQVDALLADAMNKKNKVEHSEVRLRGINE